MTAAKPKRSRTDTGKFDREPMRESRPAERSSLNDDEKADIMSGWTALVRGDNAEALSKFRQVLQKYPESVEAQYGEAATLKAMGNGQEAIRSYQKALEHLGHLEHHADRVRTVMLKHLAESALRDLEAGNGRPAAYTPPK